MNPLAIQRAFDSAFQRHRSGRLAEAERLYRQILAEQPAHVDALHYLGVIAHQTGRNDIAVDLIRRAIALRPDNGDAHGNLGAALKAGGRLDEAIVAFQQAIALRPDYPEAQYNLGNALQDQGQLDNAIAAYRQAIALRPDYAKAHNNLANALKDQGQLDEAIAGWRRAIAIRPDFAEAHSNLAYALHFHPDFDADAVAEECRRWNRQHAEPLRPSLRPHPNDRDPERRLRVGYVSPDFRDHCQSFFTIPLLSAHDRRQIDIFCYADVIHRDATTQRLQEYADQWRDIAGRSDQDVADVIRNDRIDILVDLAMHMAHNRLLVFARKPAPVSVSWLAYPGSTGLGAIDYRLSDPYLDPPGSDESIYSEKTIRLPDSFWCYDSLDNRDIPVNSPPATENKFVTFGCLNNFCKINDGVLGLWAQALRRVENSRLLLLAPPGSHRQRTLDRLRQDGIDSARVEFVSRQPRKAYLELYHRIDMELDSFPYNGHTTSLDSFSMGVPVVTLVGQTAVSRAGHSQLSNLGLTELAGQTAAQFVRIAVELASDLPRLAELRATLRSRMERSPLMDAPRFARNVEAAYRRMWRKWCETDPIARN